MYKIEIDMKTVPFECLVVQHPTIIGATVPIRRIVGTMEEEERLAEIGKRAFESGERLRKALVDQTQPQ